MFITKWSKAGEYIFIQNYSPRSYGAPAKHRIRRMRDTPKAMEKYNNHKRAEKLQMLMILNFDKGYHVTLDYPKDHRPQTYEEAEQNLRKALYKVSRRLKRQQIRFKYIAVTERGKRAAALHHHVIIENDQRVLEELMAVWGNHIKMSRMYEEGAYKNLAEYIIKVETKEEQTKGKAKYHRSRNLKEPTVRVSFMPGPIKDDPEIPEGYQLEEGSFINGYNDVLGIRYQSYTVKKTQSQQYPKHSQQHPKPKGVQKGSIWQKIRGLFKTKKRRVKK